MKISGRFVEMSGILSSRSRNLANLAFARNVRAALDAHKT
jgi:hypothetical protein